MNAETNPGMAALASEGLDLAADDDARAAGVAHRAAMAKAVLASPLELARNLAQARLALAEACELLEGWVLWKCSKRYVADHMERIRFLRQQGGLPTPQKAAESALELLRWTPAEQVPKDDRTVLMQMQFEDGELECAEGWWDGKGWNYTTTGGRVQNATVLRYSQPKGPAA